MANDPDATQRDDSRTDRRDRTEVDITPQPAPTTAYPFRPEPPGPGETMAHEAAAAPPDRRLPAVPGYEILGELGRGGVGVVYKAKQIKFGRVVALKVLLAGAHAGEKELARFRAEALTIAQIQHPNVIQVLDVGEHDGVPYLAVEFAGGGDLHKWLGGQPLPVPQAVRLVYNLARAVGAAHAKGIVHRDLKPANILLTADNVPKVADFGLAKQLGEAGPTTTGSILGTAQYMSPEQAGAQNRRVGPPTDVYALGIILYECLTGRQPFLGNSVMDTLDRVRFSHPIPLQELRTDIPPDLATIVRRCLEKVPEERYRTADELADDLARARTRPDPPPAAGFAIPTWLIPLIGIIAAVLLMGVFIQREWRPGSPKPSPSKEESTPAFRKPNNPLPATP